MMRRDIDPAREHERALSALWHLDAGTDRAEWVRLGMAAQAAGIDFDDWHQWSASAGNYKDEADCRAVWRSMKPGEGIGPGSLFAAARATGWTDPTAPEASAPGRLPWQRTSSTLPPAPVVSSADALAVWQAGEPAPPDHPYLSRKGMAPDGLRVASVGLRIAGHDCTGWLLLPVWNIEAGTLQSLQAVSPEAGPLKLSLPGCRITHGAFVAHQDAPQGRPDAAAFAAGTAYLCEGVATAASVFQASGSAAVACFGKGNVDTVARALRTRFPGLRLVLCPDRGAEHQAVEIVRQIGSPAAWVALPEHLPQNSDLNDYAAAEGLDAVRELLHQAQGAPQRFRLSSAAEVAALPPPAWLVRGVLPCVGIGALYGPSTSGKTFLALHLLARLAKPAPDWFGHRITRPAAVVYVGLEGEAGLSGRARAWQERHGQMPARFQFMTGQPFALLSEQDVTDLASAVRAAAGPGAVLCIDTLNAAAAGADENASEDMGRIIAAAKRLQADCAGLVLLVHHAGKDTAKGMRGHSSLFAACDVVLEVTRSDNRREWRLAKSKDGSDDVAHPFRLDVVDIGTDPEDGEPITSCVVVPEERAADAVRRVNLPTGGNQRIIFDALGELLRESRRFGMAGAPPTRPCIELEDAINRTRDRLACDSDQRRYRAQKAITGLANRGCIKLREGWLWLA